MTWIFLVHLLTVMYTLDLYHIILNLNLINRNVGTEGIIEKQQRLLLYIYI